MAGTVLTARGTWNYKSQAKFVGDNYYKVELELSADHTFSLKATVTDPGVRYATHAAALRAPVYTHLQYDGAWCLEEDNICKLTCVSQDARGTSFTVHLTVSTAPVHNVVMTCTGGADLEGNEFEFWNEAAPERVNNGRLVPQQGVKLRHNGRLVRVNIESEEKLLKRPEYAHVIALSLSLARDDDGCFTVSCQNLAGDDVAVLNVPEQVSLSYVVEQVASVLQQEAKAIHFYFSAGAGPLRDVDYDRRISEYLVEHTTPIKWLRAVFASESVFRTQCNESFAKFDKNKNGTLEMSEATSLVHSLCEQFTLSPPPLNKIQTAFQAADLAKDARLQQWEFPAFFKMILRGLLKEMERFDALRG